MDAQREREVRIFFNKEKKNSWTEVKNTIIEIKNTLEGNNSTLNDMEKWMVSWKTE